MSKSGDDDAFAGLVSRYRAKVYSLALRMVGDQEEAEDISQEAFINVYRALHSFRLGDKFSSWIYRITANLSIDHLRKKRHREVSIDAPQNPEGDMYIQLPDPAGWARGPNAPPGQCLRAGGRSSRQGYWAAALDTSSWISY